MKKRLLNVFLVLVLLAIAVVPLFPNLVSANHVTDKQYSFHWKDNQTIELTGMVINATFTVADAERVSFGATVNFSAIEGCPEARGILVYISKDDYESASSSENTPIETGNYGTPGNETCDYSDAFVDYLRSGDATVGFTDQTDAGGFTGQDEAATEDRDTCETVGDALGWIICPVIRATENGLVWIDEQIGRLLEIDKNQYDNAGIRAAWTTIRNIAFVILIPIMLVMVIGTMLGFSAIDAYTVKRALPRLVAAAIFISLSYYISVYLIEFSNVVGQGTFGILTAPFGTNTQDLTLLSLFSLDGGGSIFEVFLAQGALVLGAVVLIWLFTSTLLLMAGTALLILLVRQMFVVAFLLLAPLAILAWIFPGNDKLWKTWWGSFSKLLIMFPMIMGLIAVGRIFAYIIMQPEEGFLQGGVLQPLMALAAYILPYAAIPFTFKLAGGIFGTLTGMVSDREKGLFDRQRQTRAAKLERKGRQVLQTRASASRRLEELGSKGGMWKAAGFAGRRVGGYNVESAMSARTAQVAKEINDQIATGKDDDIRGLTASYAYDMGFGEAEKAGLARTENGRRQYKSLGGRWVDEANVVNGKRRWGKDTFAQQAALSYEMRKAMTDDEVDNLRTNYAAATRSWGMTDNQAGGAWIGAAFENQNQHLEYKYTDWKTGEITPKGGAGFASEVYEKRGSYNMAQQGAQTIDSLSLAYDQALNDGDFDTQRKIQAVAETFMSRYGGGGILGEDDGVQITADQLRGGGPREPSIQTNTPGAGHVAEKVRQLAVKTGVYQQPDSGTDTRPSGPPPQIPRQN